MDTSASSSAAGGGPDSLAGPPAPGSDRAPLAPPPPPSTSSSQALRILDEQPVTEPLEDRKTPVQDDTMARAPMTPTQPPPMSYEDDAAGAAATTTSTTRKSVTKSSSSRRSSTKSEDVVSPNDTDLDDDGDHDGGGSLLGSDDELGTPLGVGAPAGFGEFDDDEEFASHRFLGPSVPGDATSARALHGLRRVMVHAKPPKFASDLSGMRASITTAVSTEFPGSVRSYSLEQPLNSYQVTFSDKTNAGFTTRLSISEETAELAVRIASVERDSPAFKAGVVVGDTLLCVNDNPIEPHMTEDQVEELMVSQRGARTILFARQCQADSPGAAQRPTVYPRSHSDGKATFAESIFRRPGTARFSKAKLSSALSYGGSMMAAKLKRKKPIVHKGVMCEGCGVESITGALWTCSVCAHYNLCSDCYEVGTHGMENTEAMQALNEALVQFRLLKKCKRFNPEFLLSLRRDICKNRPDKFEYMGGWIADIVNGTAPSKITVRGIEIPHLPPTSRQRFVGKLMPLVSNRTDIEVNIEWLPDDSEPRASMERMSAGSDKEQRHSSSGAAEDLEKLRIWISDKKTRTTSPFA